MPTGVYERHPTIQSKEHIELYAKLRALELRETLLVAVLPKGLTRANVCFRYNMRTVVRRQNGKWNTTATAKDKVAMLIVDDGYLFVKVRRYVPPFKEYRAPAALLAMEKDGVPGNATARRKQRSTAPFLWRKPSKADL